MDRTLLDEDIRTLSDTLLTPFEDGMVKGASYDLRVGRRVIIALPDGHDEIDVEAEGRFEVPPGRFAVVESLERVLMPLDMKGHLSLRTHFATQGLSYSGGSIDPGYNGLLFFHVGNTSDAEITIEYGEAFVTAQFQRLTKEASKAYENGKEISEPRTLPPLPSRIVYNLVELSDRVDRLSQRLEEQEKRDKTLLDREIRALGDRVFQPFDPERVRAASYDIGVGSLAIRSVPKGTPYSTNGKLRQPLDRWQSTLQILPFESITIYSMERVQMPPNLKGRLSLRTEFANKRLVYNGGLIDPGYSGRLFFTLINIGDAPVEINYGDPLVTVELVWLPDEVEEPYPGEHEHIDPSKLPDPPLSEWDDLIKLRARVDNLDSEVKKYEPTRRIIDLVFLGGLAGIIAGIIVGLAVVALPRLPELSDPARALLAGVVLTLAIVGALSLWRRR